MTGITALSYLNAALHPVARAYKLREATRCLKARRTAWDGIVCTGTSGLLFAPSLADRLGVPCAVVRKAGTDAHSSRSFEGIVGRRLLFVDDVVESGATVRRVWAALRDAGHAVPVAQYLYRQWDQAALYVTEPEWFAEDSSEVFIKAGATWYGAAMSRKQLQDAPEGAGKAGR